MASGPTLPISNMMDTIPKDVSLVHLSTQQIQLGEALQLLSQSSHFLLSLA